MIAVVKSQGEESAWWGLVDVEKSLVARQDFAGRPV